MADFEIKISLQDDSRVVYTAANRLEYQSDILLDDLTVQLLERFDYWVGLKDTKYERRDLELLGQILYHVILPSGQMAEGGKYRPDLRKMFEADYAQFFNQASATDRFRLTLELHEDARQLAQYPWEFLFIPPEDTRPGKPHLIDGGFFLAGERNQLILTRFVPKAPIRIATHTLGEPLRILIIFSHPKELDDIDSRETRDVIAGIEKLPELAEGDVEVEVRLEENRTHKELYQLMNGEDDPDDEQRPVPERTRFKPDLVHFIGHGRPNELALLRDKEDIEKDEDEGKPFADADWCDSKQIVALFANHTPRLVFLHACESARPESVKSFSTLARELVYSKVPSVVAMQYTITNKDAGLFARTFYQEIRKGSRIDEAVRVGREALGQKKDKEKSFADRRFGTPVVYFQEQSGEPLIRRLKHPRPPTARAAATIATDRSASPAGVETRECPRCHCQAKNFCSVCKLRFRCDNCGEPYLYPLGTICENCGRDIVQPRYVEATGFAADEAKAVASSLSGASVFESGDRPKVAPLFPDGGERPKKGRL